MKKNKLYVTIIIFLIIVSCKSKNSYAIIEVNSRIDIGKIKLNDTILTKFFLKNISDNDLKIKNVKTSCGCTIAKLKDSIIKPNDSSFVEIKFIAENIGSINKSIIIDANTKDNFTVLYLKGNVEK